MRYLKKLKTKLLSKKFLIIAITGIYCLIFFNMPHDSKYKFSEKEFIGVVTNIKKTNNKVELTIKAREKLLVRYYLDENINLDIQLGDKVKIIGSLTKPSNNTIFNLFNYRNYLYSQRINYIVSLEKISIIEKNKNIFYSIKNKIVNRIETMDNKVYLKAFILGDTSEISYDIKDSYKTNGISHLFSISGMHVSFISGVLYFLLRNINKSFKYIIVILSLLFFSFLVNFSPSVMRSFLLILLILMNNFFKLNIKTFDLFIMLTCLFLIYNPYFIYNSGFLYSFIISGFLICYKDKLILKNYILGILKVSCIAFLAGIPITILNSFELNFLSPILNIFFVPLITFIIFPLSLLSLFFNFLVPIHLIFVIFLENISLFFSKINIFTFIFAKPNIIIILIYYVVIILVFYNRKYIIVLIILFLLHFNICIFNRYHVLDFLDVGQGDSILIRLANNSSNILIDTGGLYDNSNNYISNNIIIPYLKSIGISRLNYLIITHGDYDHMGEAINLVENFKVEKVIFNCGEFNDLEKELIEVLNKKKIPYYSCIKELNIDKNKLYFLNNKDYGNENNNSSVIYTELNDHKFLFMGDAGVEVEEDLIEKYNLQDIDVLKVGHHGSKTSSSKNFIEDINPKYSIISVGKNNRYGHPNKEVLENLNDSKIYRTDEDGSIMFKINNNRLKIETFSQ